MSEEAHPSLLSVEGTFYTVFQVPSASLVAGGSHVSLTSVARAVCVGPSLPSGVWRPVLSVLQACTPVHCQVWPQHGVLGAPGKHYPVISGTRLHQ